MSYILDALKKADRERNLGEVPDLESAHWRERRRRPGYRWFGIVLLLLLVNGILLAILFERNDGAGRDPVVGQDVRMPVQTGAATAGQLPASPDTLPAPVAVPRPQPAPLATSRPRVPVAPPVVAEPAAQTATATASAARPSVPSLPDEAGTDAVTDNETELPEWNELSLEFRSSMTLPRVDVHVYSEVPRRRFVLVNLEKFREGDTLPNGAVLEKIHPNSIQLFYRGERFRVDR